MATWVSMLDSSSGLGYLTLYEDTVVRIHYRVQQCVMCLDAKSQAHV